MRTIQEIRDDLNHKVRTLGETVDKITKSGNAMTAEERSSTDALKVDIENLKKEVETVQDHEKRMGEFDALIKSAKMPEQRGTQADQPGKEHRGNIEVLDNGIRYGQLKAFKGQDAERRAFTSGQWYRASILNNYSAQRWCTDHGVNFRAQSESVNSAGGALVPDVLSQAIIDLREQYGVFRRECDVMPMGSDTMSIIRRAGGVTASFTAEGAAIGTSDASWGTVSLSAKKLGVLNYFSTELAEDAIINIADYLASEFAYAMALKEDECGFNGDGSATYGGITGITVKALQAAYAGGKVTAGTDHDTFAELDSADITSLIGALPAYALPNAKFYCSQLAFATVFSRLAIGAGGNTIQSVQGAYSPTFLGYPIVVSQVLPAGASTDYSAAWMLGFGDLRKAAILGDRRGVQIKRSDEIKFVEDQVALKGTSRIDINVHSMGTTTAAGPFVSLVGA